MTLIREPMKAPNEIIPFDDPRIRYPQFESQKYDGFRNVLLPNKTFITPSGLQCANKNIVSYFQEIVDYSCDTQTVFDAEIWSPEIPFSELQSILRSHNAPIPNHIGLYVFDALRIEEWLEHIPVPSYTSRYFRYMNDLMSRQFPKVTAVVQTLLSEPTTAQSRFIWRINNNQEGSMLRSPSFGYKHGRCTHKENGIFKFKEFQDIDAIIVDAIDQRTLDENIERTQDDFGRLKKVHTQESYSLTSMIGALLVTDPDHPEYGIFKIKPGKGHTQEVKHQWWLLHQENALIGRHIQAKFMPHGTKDKPRIGTLIRFRPDKD